ncbi:quinone oxidoreductase [Kaistia dalseonensis]|uniref:NADPH2:quinone reductase n=1 Tax=Kaistia dalseonensis TaxID=410840 RepID=A0ABU0H716_9HYPH|nr:quinone oxidoreductase [Kaistia dalseonensis]MCX5495484.1 quinone oxidoreductase [Kaistia dalseonensis]MDQ0438075.1 NADPH2:quinone reductase [Kaistia dalseonensis]
MRAVILETTGPAENLHLVETAPGEPGPGEIRIRHDAIGVNFVDIYQRRGLYPLPGLPAVLGVEGAGVVEAIGAGVQGFGLGDRVTYAGLPVGGYQETRVIGAGRLLHLPDAIASRTAAAAMLRGLTAYMLLFRVYPVGPGTTVLVHAAAGGLGLILTQWAKRLGATVIGTVGSEEKAEIAIAHGLDHAILYRSVDVVAETRRLTDGRGVDVAYDGIGGDMLQRTLDCVRLFGTVASVGQAGGAIPPIDVNEIGPRRSLSLARPSVLHFANDPVAYRTAAKAVFAVLKEGLVVTIGTELDLADAVEAHRILESGRSSGSVLLRP